jgi:hypothetical protein
MDFDAWFTKSWARATSELAAAEPAEREVPDGVFEMKDGTYRVHCCVCDRMCELPVGIDEIPMVGYEHYGNCGPSCCP